MADDLYYGDASLGKRLYVAHATVTAPVIYTTAAGTGGPLLYNGSTDKIGKIVAVGFATKTASTVAGALGFTGGTAQAAAPTTTTAVESTGNLYQGAPKSSISPFRIGTVTTAGSWFMAFAQVTTGALTVGDNTISWIPMGRMISIPPGYWVSVAGSATLTTGVFEISVVWEEFSTP